MLEGDRMVESVEEVVMQAMGEVAGSAKGGMIADDGKLHGVEEVESTTRGIGLEPSQNGSDLDQPVDGLQDLQAPFAKRPQDLQRLVDIVLGSGIFQEPLDDDARVQDEPHGRPKLRALAISASVAGAIWLRSSKIASMAAARQARSW